MLFALSRTLSRPASQRCKKGRENEIEVSKVRRPGRERAAGADEVLCHHRGGRDGRCLHALSPSVDQARRVGRTPLRRLRADRPERSEGLHLPPSRHVTGCPPMSHNVMPSQGHKSLSGILPSIIHPICDMVDIPNSPVSPGPPETAADHPKRSQRAKEKELICLIPTTRAPSPPSPTSTMKGRKARRSRRPDGVICVRRFPAWQHFWARRPCTYRSSSRPSPPGSPPSIRSPSG